VENGKWSLIRSIIVLKVAIDALNISRGGGLTYLIEFIQAFKENDIKSIEIHVWSSESVLEVIPDGVAIKHKVWPVRNFFSRLIWQTFSFQKVLKANKIDILLVPGTLYLGPFKPYVVISQNMLPFELREAIRFGFSLETLRFFILRILQGISIFNASGVIFLSEYAGENIKKIVKVKNSTVIPHGINDNYRVRPKEQRSINDYDSSKPYKIVCTSFIGPYKHQWNVAEAVGKLREMGYPVSIDFIGKPVFDKSVARLRKVISKIDPKMSWINILDEIAYENLPSIYKNYDLAIFSSSCENLPIILLEKMASGLPIACSNMGPMPSVLKNCGLYFNPLSIESIQTAIEKLLCNKDLRVELSNSSFIESKKYLWSSSVNRSCEYLGKIAEVNNEI